MLLTDWLGLLSASCLKIRAQSRTRRLASSCPGILSQPESLEKRSLLSAANVLLTDVSGATGFQVIGAAFGKGP